MNARAQLAWRIRDLPAALLSLEETARRAAHGLYNAALLAGREKPIEWTLKELRRRR